MSPAIVHIVTCRWSSTALGIDSQRFRPVFTLSNLSDLPDRSNAIANYGIDAAVELNLDI